VRGYQCDGYAAAGQRQCRTATLTAGGQRTFHLRAIRDCQCHPGDRAYLRSERARTVESLRRSLESD